MATYRDLLAFNNGEYINQYAGLPLQEIRQTAETLSNRHYQNLASASQLQILQNQLKAKALPGAKAYFDQHISGVQSALEDMAKNGGENSTARINALATSFQGDQGMLNAMARADEYNKQTSLIDELTAKGERPLYDTARRQQLASAAPTDDVYNAPYSSAVEGYIDPFTDREKIWDIIKPDSYKGDIKAALKTAPAELIGKAFSGENPDLPLFFEAVTRGGISGQKIKSMLDNAWDTYKNTKSYQQQKGKLVGKNDDTIRQEFYEQGLMRVFNETSREYRPTPSWAGRGEEVSTPQTLRTPMNAKARAAFEAGNLDPYTTLGKASVYKAIDDAKQARMETATSEKHKQYYTDLIHKLEAEANTPDAARQVKRNDYYKTAMMDAGQDPSSMSEEQIAAASNTPGGDKLLKDYLARVGGERLQYPTISNTLSNEEANQQKGLAKRTALDREFIDLDSGEKIGSLKDENGKLIDNELATAIENGDFEIQGTVDPQHIFSELDPEGENFVRGQRAAVYIKEGGVVKKVRNVMMSALPGTTTPQDINENIIYNKAMELPGRWAKLNDGLEVVTPSSPQMADVLYNQYVQQQGEGKKLTREQFGQAAAILKENGKLVPASDYTTIATELARRGIKLPRK